VTITTLASSPQHTAVPGRPAAHDAPGDELLFLLGHELRNPVNALCTAMDVLQAAPAGSAMAMEAQAVMRRQGQRLALLVDELLHAGRALTGRSPLQSHPVRICRMLERLAREHEAGPVRFTAPAAPVWVRADALWLEEALRRILSFAARAHAPLQVTLESRGARVQLDLAPQGLLEPRDADLGLLLARRLLEQQGASLYWGMDRCSVSLPATEPPVELNQPERLPAVTPRQARGPE
jgi:hypothetical protein